MTVVSAREYVLRHDSSEGLHLPCVVLSLIYKFHLAGQTTCQATVKSLGAPDDQCGPATDTVQRS